MRSSDCNALYPDYELEATDSHVCDICGEDYYGNEDHKCADDVFCGECEWEQKNSINYKGYVLLVECKNKNNHILGK